MADPASKITTEQEGEDTVIHETSVTKTIYQAPATSVPSNDNNLVPGGAVNDNVQTNTPPSSIPSSSPSPSLSPSVSSSSPGSSFAPGNAANDNANPVPAVSAPATEKESKQTQPKPSSSQQPKAAPSAKEDNKKTDAASDSAKNNENKNQVDPNNTSQQSPNNEKASVDQLQPANQAQVQNQTQTPKPGTSSPPARTPASQGQQQIPSSTQANPGNSGRKNSQLGRQRANRRPKKSAKSEKSASGKDTTSKGKKFGDSSKLDTKQPSSKVAVPASSKKLSAAKGGVKNLANAKQQAVKVVAGKAVDKLGKWAGLNAVQKEFVLHCVGLVIELLAAIIGIGLIAFVIHIFIVIGFLLKKDNFNQVQPLLLLFSVILTIEAVAVFTFIAAVIPAVVCQVGQSRIPSGIPAGIVSRIGSAFHADIGVFEQLCSQLNLQGAGVGNGLSSNSGSASNNGATASMQNQNVSTGPLLAQSLQESLVEAIIPGTVLTTPQALPSEFATQTNQAGYVSPAECRLGDLPYSNETSLQRVRLPDGTERIVTLPVHQTVECIQNDPTKTSVRSIHTGKIVRLVYDDPKLGNYITIEYPNNLRLSYYHLSLLPNLTLAQTITAGEVIGNLAQTGENTFRGVTLRFELKSTDGTWQPFDPTSPNPTLSILTPFPCANDVSKRCLLL